MSMRSTGTDSKAGDGLLRSWMQLQLQAEIYAEQAKLWTAIILYLDLYRIQVLTKELS